MIVKRFCIRSNGIIFSPLFFYPSSIISFSPLPLSVTGHFFCTTSSYSTASPTLTTPNATTYSFITSSSRTTTFLITTS